MANLTFQPSPAQCTDEIVEYVCSKVISKFQEGYADPIVDLSNATQSGWIWASFGVFTPLCVFGVFGNILTLVMFSRYIKTTTTSVFIIALAIVDLLVCGISMPIWLYSLLDKQRTDPICQLEKFINILAIPLSGSILLVIAIDRFLLIFLVRTDIVTKFRAKIIIIVLALVCLASAIPLALSTSSYQRMDDDISSLFCKGEISCDISDCRPNRDYISDTVRNGMWIAIIYSFLVLTAAFVVFYMLIFCKVYKMHKKMNSWRTQHQPPVNNNRRKVTEDHATFATVANEATANEACNAALVTQNVKENDSDSDGVRLMTSRTPPKQCVKKKKRLPHLHTAITLALVTCSFVIAYFPLIIMVFLKSCEGDGYHKCNRNDFKYFIWNFYFINHITNPIIYAFMNPRFKEALSACCKRRCPGS